MKSRYGRDFLAGSLTLIFKMFLSRMFKLESINSKQTNIHMEIEALILILIYLYSQSQLVLMQVFDEGSLQEMANIFLEFQLDEVFLLATIVHRSCHRIWLLVVYAHTFKKFILIFFLLKCA